MGMSYQGILNGHLTAMEVAEAIQIVYGGSNFSVHFTHTPDYKIIQFDENLSQEALAEKPWNRKGMVKTRHMSVFLNGMVACDYADVTTEPMTLVSLGHSGECKKVIDALVEHFGGYIRDEAVGCEFIPYTNPNI